MCPLKRHGGRRGKVNMHVKRINVWAGVFVLFLVCMRKLHTSPTVLSRFVYTTVMMMELSVRNLCLCVCVCVCVCVCGSAG